MNSKFQIISIALVFLCINLYSQDKNGKTYTDGNKNVFLPEGELSFADKFIHKIEGNPRSEGQCTNASNALGEPDYDGNPRNQTNFFSLGCGGEAIFEFTNNGLVNQDGPDLYIFEIGPSVEPTNIYISEDNIEWIFAGKTSGGTSSIDLEGKVENGKIFYYVKLVDLKMTCGGRGGTDGADIDAIAAIGSSLIEDVPVLSNEIVDALKVVSRTITVTIWDDSKEDGDIVDVILNGKTLMSNQKVTNKGETIELNLRKGLNTFEIKAINEGSISPNTAAIKISDGSTEYIKSLSSEAGKSKALEIILE